MLEYETLPRRQPRKPTIWDLIFIVIGTLLWALVYPAMIGVLPRKVQGEAASFPWGACVAVYFVVPCILAYLGASMVSRSLRVRGIAALVAFVCIYAWYFEFGGNGFLSKAWRRGF